MDDYDFSDQDLPIVLESGDDSQSNNANQTMKEVSVPTHPISSMQGAFAESFIEASGSSTPSTSRSAAGNSVTRRQALLDQSISEATHASRWRQKPGEKYHKLWKLMAQISFGIYLLLNGIAKDDDQVMAILQGHVDEVDEFLESTLEDFDLAQQDINERLKLLKLPLENIDIFDVMLEDRAFRLQIVNGNERIEHVIHRTTSAMNDALKDVQQGLDACKEFTIYLAQEEQEISPYWREERPDMGKVFMAMKGNVNGWWKALVSLQTKGEHLDAALVQLGSIVAEMDRRAGEISRKARISNIPENSLPISSLRDSLQNRRSVTKIPPNNLNIITPDSQETVPTSQLVSYGEQASESESVQQSSEAEPEPDFILKPHTYSPAPSPKPPEPVLQEAAEIRRKSPTRKRFSLKRKETPSEITLQPPPTTDRLQLRQVNSAETPPSRGLDSAYCSDLERPSIPTTSPSSQTSHRANSPSRRPPPPSTSYASPIFTQDHMPPSPRSDKQYFRPVLASPNSPLQRPWTAGPSNLRNSQYGDRARRQPSEMGMSMMSDMTTMTENGKKVKKKRSAFGWLKKAFSLSEEEKAAFEEKRREPTVGYYDRRPPPQFLDGRRVR